MHESMFASLGLGFVLGLKHATEADHLAAVSTIVSERRSLRQAASVGALWGVGHSASLMFAGFLVVGLGIVIPERIANLLELLVASMIIFLGMRLLHAHIHSHTHGGKAHIHMHFHDRQPGADHTHGSLSGLRPLFVGIVHGLAGSAALTLLVLSEVVRNGSAFLGFAYLLIFGVGSIGGMLIMSSIISLPFRFGLQFFQRSVVPLRLLTGLFSTTFGVFYAWRIFEKL
jgi:sulfite exporter TauE/SafE